MKYINVFANMSVQGKVTIWAKGVKYDSREAAVNCKTILPDSNFHYLGTVREDKEITIDLLKGESQVQIGKTQRRFRRICEGQMSAEDTRTKEERFNSAHPVEIDGVECSLTDERDYVIFGERCLAVSEARQLRDWLNEVLPS